MDFADYSMFDNFQFIKLVELHPCIWNQAVSDYTNLHKKQQSWIEIARDMFDDYDTFPTEKKRAYEKELLKRWKSLRNSFARELARRRKKQAGSDLRWRTYKYFDPLSFLVPTNCGKGNRTNTLLNFNTTPEEDNKDLVSLATQYNSDAILKYESSEDGYGEEPFIQGMDIAEEPLTINDSEDPDRCFLLSLLNHFKKVPEDKKIDVKLDIMKIIKDAIEPSSSSIPDTSIKF